MSLQPIFPPKRFDNYSPCLGDAQKVWMRSYFSLNSVSAVDWTTLPESYSYSLVFFSRAMAKNGSSRCFSGQKRVYLKTIGIESVVGRIWLANTPFHPFLAKNDQVLPIISTLLSFHPLSVILCSLPVRYSNRPARTTRTIDRKFSPMYGHTYSKSMDQPGKVANPERGQLPMWRRDWPKQTLNNLQPMITPNV